MMIAILVALLVQDVPDKNGLLPGLLITDYKQPVDYEWNYLDQLGAGLGEPYLTKTLTMWKRRDKDKVAVARGYLKITTTGEYSFCTESWHNKDQLFIGTTEVVPYGHFAKPDAQPPKIMLAVGWYPITSVGWCSGKDYVSVRWTLPRTKECQPVPDTALFYRPVK